MYNTLILNSCLGAQLLVLVNPLKALVSLKWLVSEVKWSKCLGWVWMNHWHMGALCLMRFSCLSTKRQQAVLWVTIQCLIELIFLSASMPWKTQSSIPLNFLVGKSRWCWHWPEFAVQIQLYDFMALFGIFFETTKHNLMRPRHPYCGQYLWSGYIFCVVCARFRYVCHQTPAKP